MTSLQVDPGFTGTIINQDSAFIGPKMGIFMIG